MNYGLGFNSLTGKIRGDALVPGQAKEIKGVEGQTIRYYLSKVESVEELHTQLGLSAEVNAQFGLFGASAKFDFAQTSTFNSYSVFMVARVEVINAFRQLDGPRLDPPAEALLKPGGDRDRFAEQFGDSFIIGMQTGGEFCAVWSSGRPARVTSSPYRPAWRAPTAWRSTPTSPSAIRCARWRNIGS